MRLIKGLLICVLATGWMAGCSDDTTTIKKDKGVDQKVTDSSVDLGTDATPPTPDGAPDQLVQQDTGLTPDGATPDTTVVTPDQGVQLDQATPNPDQGAGGNATCANAQLLTFAAGAVTVNGDTTGVADEFPTLECGGWTMDGGQRYYKFNATKDQWYKVLFTSTFSYGYAIFFTSSTCTEADIQTDCQSAGVSGETAPYASAGQTRAGYFKAPATGPVYLLVDSEGAEGTFTLSLEEMPAVTNGTCAGATPLTFFNGKATLRGDLGPKITPNEYATDVTCGGTSAYDEAQAYYKFTAATGKAYKITVKADSADYLYSYAFQAASCGTGATISTDCGSAGATGAVSPGHTSKGTSMSYVFTPGTAGDYVIAIDTRSTGEYGGFTLTVEDFTPPTNGACATPTPITLTGGAATVNGSTLGLVDEYPLADCGGFTDFDGPQAYYEFMPAAGKYYKVTLKPTFSAYAYWFQKTSCGTVASINADCGGTNGGKMGSISSGSTGSMIISGQSAALLIAVDSSAPGTAGDFALTIEEVIPPTNDTCATATALTLGTPVTADTSLATDQSNLSSSGCTGGSTPGPELFYSVALTANKSYAFKADANYDGAIYVLDACGATPTCLAGADNSFSAGVEQVLYTPTADTTVIFVVDSWSTSALGTATVSVTEVVAPTNDTCATAKVLTPTAGKVTETGDTTLASETLDLTSLGCTGYSTKGQELFYSFPVTAGKSYNVKVDAAWDAALYVLDGCAATPTCLSGADNSSSGVESVFITPTTTGNVIIGVDAFSTSDFGTFTLTVEEYQAPVGPTLVAPFSLDFESSNGTLVGNGDWEWGQLAWPATTPTACDGTPTPPPNNQGHVATQAGMWGTVLNGCYNNLGNHQGSSDCTGNAPQDDSVLTFKIDLTQGACAAATAISLSIWNYTAGVNGFDKAMFFVNGTMDATASFCTTSSSGWVESKLDLSALKNTTAEISLNWAASAVTNDAGWYIDEISVTCQ